MGFHVPETAFRHNLAAYDDRSRFEFWRQPARNAETDEAFCPGGYCFDEGHRAIPVSGADDDRKSRGARDLCLDGKARSAQHRNR